MTDTRYPPDHDPIDETADQRLQRSSREPLEAPADARTELDGQLGPDEISEPDEVVNNHLAKSHH